MAEIREMLPDYLLGLLESDQTQAVAHALEGSPELQQELEALKAVMLRIPEGLHPVLPPPSTWGKIQARLQLPRPAWTRWAAAAAVVALLLVGAWGLNQYAINRTLQAEQSKIAQWVAIPKAKWHSFGSDGKTYGTMIWLDGKCYMVMEDPAPRGKVYQAWGRKENDIPISLGVFKGRTFQTQYTGYKSVGVSLEPKGGSPQPTHPLGRVSTEDKEKTQNPSIHPVSFNPQSKSYLSELKAVFGPSGTKPYC